MKKIALLIILLLLLCQPVHADTSEYTGKDYTHDKRYNNSLIVNGVDASCYQDVKSNWEKAKKSGIDFAIFRVTLTRSVSGAYDTDNAFEKHFKRAGDAGIMRGIYVFSQARNAEEGEAEALYAIDRLKQLGIGPEDVELPVFMDYEFHHKDESRLKDLTRDDALMAAESFCNIIRDAGYMPGVYANTTFYSEYLDDGIYFDEDVSIWCAQYNNKNNSGCDYDIWQYSSSGRVSDIYESGSSNLDDVDMNYWYIDQTINPDAGIRITGPTSTEYTGKPVTPELELYDGKKRLKENRDYIIKGIDNISGQGYAYIKGINKYTGYALIPISIQDKSVGLTLPSTVLKSSRYPIGENGISNVPDGTTAEKLLSSLSIQSEEHTLEVIDSQNNIVFSDEKLLHTDRVGIFKDETLVGIVDITLDNEYGINYLRRR